MQLRRHTVIIHILDNHFFDKHVTDASYSANFTNPCDISICIQHDRIIVRLISKERAQWRQHRRTKPYTDADHPFAVTSHFIARVIDDIINDKNQYRNNHRHTETTFSDNTTKRSTDKEEQQTRQS